VKVFIVEDSPLLRGRLETMVAAIPGAHVSGHADSAAEATQRVLRERPDAVVLDLHLREGNGLDVLRAVRAAAPAIAVYILTNYPEEKYRQIAAELGAAGFFDKSSEFDRLREAIAARA
jgi:DNA-binding NarL/FixJ family response regulator